MKVIVIGAGVSGLTLTAALKRLAPQAQVMLFEREVSANSRPQGYAIGLRNGTGLAAIAELGLRDAVIGGDSIRVTNLPFTDQDGRVLLSLGSSLEDPNTTYRVQRLRLKDVLLDAADERLVHFGMRCTGFERSGGRVLATFEDGSRVEADYLVACDGAGSVIRQQAIGDDRRFLGLVAIHAEAATDVEHHLLDGGYFMTLGRNGCSFFCYRQPGGVYWSYVVHARSEAEVAQQSREVLLERVRDETTGWHQLVGKLVAEAAAESVGVRGYYDKEPISRIHDDRVWMIGDGAHPMCPFQGQGANMALMDAVRLARHLAADSQPAEEVAALEADIVKRGRKAVMDSRSNARRFHETGALAQYQRDLIFRLANVFIKLFTKRD